jgi:hemerythrin-like domain-containing protein
MPRISLRIIRDEHAAVSAILRSLVQLIEQGPGSEPARFFEVVRAMLFYIDEFPERLHHPKESNLLFPKLARSAPELMPLIRQLEEDHMKGEGKVRDLQHMLLAWELLGDSRRDEFVQAGNAYVKFYLEHMGLEEHQLLPAAERVLSDHDWDQLDAAFAEHRDPLAAGVRDPRYETLFTRIVAKAPEAFLSKGST